MSAPAACPKCNAALAPGENFCAACGHKLQATPEERAERFDKLKAVQEKQQFLRNIKSGRGWILGVGILCLLSGIVLYFLTSKAVEASLAPVTSQVAAMDPEQRAEFNAKFTAETGMSFDAAVEKDRRGPLLLLVVNLVLFVVYTGLWIWAKGSPFPAALVALILFLAVMLVNAILEPKTLAQGWLVKILVIAGLGSAVSSAYKYRRMQESGAA